MWSSPPPSLFHQVLPVLLLLSDYSWLRCLWMILPNDKDLTLKYPLHTVDSSALLLRDTSTDVMTFVFTNILCNHICIVVRCGFSFHSFLSFFEYFLCRVISFTFHVFLYFQSELPPSPFFLFFRALQYFIVSPRIIINTTSMNSFTDMFSSVLSRETIYIFPVIR